MVMEAPPNRPGPIAAATSRAKNVVAAVAKTSAIRPPVPSAGTVPTAASLPPLAEIPWTRVDIDLYEVAREGVIVGYVEVVGSVFVALGGPRYDRAVEVGQNLTFHSAVEAVLQRGA